MRKLMAAALSTVMLAGTFPAAILAEETSEPETLIETTTEEETTEEATTEEVVSEPATTEEVSTEAVTEEETTAEAATEEETTEAAMTEEETTEEATTEAPVVETFLTAYVTLDTGFTFRGHSLTLTLEGVGNEKGETAFSGKVELPAIFGEDGEETVTIELEDVLREIEEDTYVNVEALLAPCQDLDGSTILTSLATILGLRDTWVKIPALEINVEDMEIPEISEELQAALMGSFEPFVYDVTDNSVTVTFDEETLIAFIGNIREFNAAYGEEMCDTVWAIMDNFDLTEIYGDYITAAAEGVNAVQPSITVEAGEEKINQMIEDAVEKLKGATPEKIKNKLVQLIQAVDEADDTIPSSYMQKLQKMTDLSYVESYLATVDVEGEATATLKEDGVEFSIKVSVTRDDEELAEYYMVQTIKLVEELEEVEVEIPEDTVEATDIVKNVAGLVYTALKVQN